MWLLIINDVYLVQKTFENSWTDSKIWKTKFNKIILLHRQRLCCSCIKIQNSNRKNRKYKYIYRHILYFRHVMFHWNAECKQKTLWLKKVEFLICQSNKNIHWTIMSTKSKMYFLIKQKNVTTYKLRATVFLDCRPHSFTLFLLWLKLHTTTIHMSSPTAKMCSHATVSTGTCSGLNSIFI